MNISTINHVEQAHNRLVSQYKESENLKAYIAAIVKQDDDLEKSLFDLLDKRHLDVAEGEQLDVIGRIVGLNRILINASILGFFTIGPSDNDGFGDKDDPSVGGIFIGPGQPTQGNIRLSDIEYRLFIRAKILSNHTNCSMVNLTNIYSFLLNAKVIIYDWPGAMHINVNRKLSRVELALFKSVDRYGRYIIPKPLGIKLYASSSEDPPFGFEGAPENRGFGVGKFVTPMIT